MSEIKILHIINSLDIGGNERFLLQLLEHLPRERFHQEVCVPDRGKDATRDLERECQRLHTRIAVIRALGNLDARVLLKVKRQIVRGRFDIVHTHLIYSQIYGRLAARAARAKRVVSSEQNVYEAKARAPFRWLERKLSGQTDCIIACSNRVREHLIRNVGVNPLKVVVVPNAVDTNVFFPIGRESALFEKVKSVRRELGIREGDVVIGSVGHLSPQKGQKFLVAAIPLVRARYPRAKFVLVGKPTLRKELQEQARGLGVKEAVRFAGIRGDVPILLNCFDVFVLPSLWEGFGTAIIEALACGVPVVASRVGGIPEIIEHGVDGLLVPAGHARPLAENVIRLLDDSSLRRDIVYRGLRKAMGRFSVGRMVETMAKVYLQMFYSTKPASREVSRNGDRTVGITSTIGWRG